MTHRLFTWTYCGRNFCTQTCNCVCIHAKLCHRRNIPIGKSNEFFWFSTAQCQCWMEKWRDICDHICYLIFVCLSQTKKAKPLGYIKIVVNSQSKLCWLDCWIARQNFMMEIMLSNCQKKSYGGSHSINQRNYMTFQIQIYIATQNLTGRLSIFLRFLKTKRKFRRRSIIS